MEKQQRHAVGEIWPHTFLCVVQVDPLRSGDDVRAKRLMLKLKSDTTHLTSHFIRGNHEQI
jgi:hypothetical protein